MKKSVKKISALLIAAVLSTSVIFAQGMKRTEGPAKGNDRNERNEARGPEFGGVPGMFVHNNEVVLGVVKQVNVKAGTVRILNSDGRETEVKVSPFTKIIIADDDKRQSNGPNAELSDINNGAWALVTKFNSGTKTIDASAIFITKNTTKRERDLSNAK